MRQQSKKPFSCSSNSELKVLQTREADFNVAQIEHANRANQPDTEETKSTYRKEFTEHNDNKNTTSMVNMINVSLKHEDR